MKYYFYVFCILFLGVAYANSQSRIASSNIRESALVSKADSCPILSNTTAITYEKHTNSGMAIYTTVTLRQDRLIWDYNEARNDFRLKDSCKYDKEEFEELVDKLSKIHFSVIRVSDFSCGGAGYGYHFESNSNHYLYYDNTGRLSGDYRQAENLIQSFINTHKTNRMRMGSDF